VVRRASTDYRSSVTPFACADYPAGGAPSIRSRRSDGVVTTPTILKANEWLRAGTAELESSAPKVAHPGGNTSSNVAEATKAFLARKCINSTLASPAAPCEGCDEDAGTL
jgi:hypothetical protein